MLRVLADERLARRAAAGDRAAFGVIFERHHQALYRYCRALLRHDEDARDALQNTFTRALQALEGETREIAVRPWLYRIAHNEAISLARRRRPHRELDPEQAGTAPGADAQAIATERMRDLVADLDELPERQRSALVLRELNDLGYAEIGAALETTEHAARQAVYEARVMLAELQEGRAMACADIRTRISARDGRLLRPRRVRAHLRSCEGCRAFRDAIDARRADLGALAPPLAPAAAAALLHGIIGGGGGAGGGGLLAALGAGQGAAATTVGAKGLAVVAAAATIGGGAAVLDQHVLPHARPAAPPAALQRDAGHGGAVPAGLRSPHGTGPASGTTRTRGAAEPRRGAGTPAPTPGREPAAAETPAAGGGHPTPTAPASHGESGGDSSPGVVAPAQAPAADEPQGSSGTTDEGASSRGNSAGGNPTPGTPPAHSNAGGNGKGKAKGLANAPMTNQAAPAPAAPAGGTGDVAATEVVEAPAAPAHGNGNGKAKGLAKQAAGAAS